MPIPQSSKAIAGMPASIPGFTPKVGRRRPHMSRRSSERSLQAVIREAAIRTARGLAGIVSLQGDLPLAPHGCVHTTMWMTVICQLPLAALSKRLRSPPRSARHDHELWPKAGQRACKSPRFGHSAMIGDPTSCLPVVSLLVPRSNRLPSWPAGAQLQCRRGQA